MLNTTEILSTIKTIRSTGKKLDKLIQQAALGCVAHSCHSGDVTLGQKLVDALPDGVRKNALLGFLEEFGQFAIVKRSVVYIRVQRLFDRCNGNVAATDEYVESIDKHWTAFKPEPLPKSKYDCMVELKAFVEKMQRQLHSGNAVHGEVYLEVEKVLAKFQDIEEEEVEPSMPNELQSKLQELQNKQAA